MNETNNTENTMSVTINVNSEQFNALLRREIENLPKDVWTDIIRQMVSKALNDENGVANCLVKKRSVGYGSYVYEPGDVLKEVISKIDFTDIVNEFSETVKTELREHWKEMIMEAMWNRMVGRIFDSPHFSEAFRFEHMRHHSENKD